MISFALFSVNLVLPGGDSREISVCDLAVNGFTFRLAKEDDPGHMVPSAVTCRTNGFREHGLFTVSRFTIEPVGTSRYDRTYRLTSDDPSFTGHMKNLMRDLAEYSELKNEGTDAELTRRYTACPRPGENTDPSDFVSWRASLLSAVRPDAVRWLEAVSGMVETVWQPSGLPLLRRIAEAGVPFAWREALTQAGLRQHPLFLLIPQAVCIGNSYCPELLPDTALLTSLIGVCREARMNMIFVLPPLREDLLDRTESILRDLDRLVPDGPLELVVNDPGICSVIHRLIPGRAKLIAGPLLIRRRKDPRVTWWRGDTGKLALTSANSGSYRRWLESVGIRHVIWEACGYPIQTENGDFLQIPFYQVSTGSVCPLRAAAVTGRRGNQFEDAPCRHECEQHCFLYGDGIRMTGRFNSLFGADLRSLEDSDYLSSLLRPGISRLVIDLL